MVMVLCKPVYNVYFSLSEVSRLVSNSNESPKIVLSGGPKHLQQHHHHHHHHKHRTQQQQQQQHQLHQQQVKMSVIELLRKL